MRKKFVAIMLISTLVFGSSMPVWAAESEEDIVDIISEEDLSSEDEREDVVWAEANEEETHDLFAEVEALRKEALKKIPDEYCKTDVNGLLWNLKDGVLTISGNGVIEKNPDFDPMYDIDVVYKSSFDDTEIPLTFHLGLCEQINSIVIEKGITGIGDHAFDVNHEEVGDGWMCMREISIPDSVTKVGEYAFNACGELEKIVIPNSVTEIGEYAFAECYKMKEVSIPNSVTEIKKGTFLHDVGLTKVIIPSSVTKIDEIAFDGCFGLTEMSIPNSVTEIGNAAFWGCSELSKVSSLGSVTEIRSNTFNMCPKLEKVTIPRGVTKIAYGAFGDCTSLSEVTIPDSVKSIGYAAFSRCNGLQSVTFRGDLPEISNEWETSSYEYSKDVPPFEGVTTTAYYPAGNATYTDEAKAAYGAGVTWETKEMAKMDFTDVNQGDWYYDAADYVFSRGIMTGMNPTEFGPGITLSRAQFATILYRMQGEPAAEYDANAFPDVKDGEFYTYPAMWAKSTGVVNGYDDGRFGPADSITREQMAVMMYRYAKMLELDTSVRGNMSEFPDAGKVSRFADEAMQWAIGEGLIRGDQNKINPQGNAERAQCATIIMRFMEAYGL